MSEPTRYEVILVHDKHGKFLHCYTARKNLSGIINAAQMHTQELVTFTGMDAHRWRKGTKAADGLCSSKGWTLRFSGRTQRDAKAEGELPWYRDSTPCPS